jgi:acylphosphatase
MSVDMNDIAIKARITGKVQGVYYRASVRNEAAKLGLVGWVRNEADGSVLAYVVGADQSVSKLIDFMWQGPRAASVLNVAVEKVELPAERPAIFQIVR